MTGDRRLTDCPNLIDPEDVGTPLYFISHAWDGGFKKLMDAILHFLREASRGTRVWIDCVAVNQHQDTNPDQNKEDVAAFEDVIKTTKAGTIVVVDSERCSPASRVWCLYE